MAGVPLLPGILPANARLIVEIAFGANLNADASNWALANQWIDVTADLWQANRQTITISPLGRSDEFGQAQPAGCRLVLDNSTGKYSKGPQSSNYPFVRRNVPLRVSVTLNGITIFTRFFGYITTFEPHDDPSAKVAWVNVSAYGSTRRIIQGKAPAKSALYRSITKAAVQPVAYYPMEDGSSSQQANSPIPGVPPATFAYQQYVGAPHFAAVNGPPGSDKLPDFSRQGNFKVTLPAQATATTWRVQCVAKTNALPTTSDYVGPLEFFTNNGAVLNTVYIAKPAGISPLNGLTFQDSLGHAFGDGVAYDDGLWHEIRVVMTQSGGNIVLNVFLDGALRINQTYAATLNNVSGFNGSESSMTNSDGYAAGHFAVWNTNSGLPDTLTAMGGYNGETATARLARLFTEDGGLGTPLVVTGSSATLMGPQGVDTWFGLVRECEATDIGVLYDGASQGCNYVARAAKYNQAAALTLDAAAAHIDPPFEPKDDDLSNRNLFVVRRKNGTEVPVQDKTGPLGTDTIGVYDAATTVNVASESALPNVGAWLLRMGTVDEPYRYPKLGLDLSAIPSKAFDWLSTTIGERVDILNLSTVSSRHPPGVVSLILEGYAETLSPYAWTVLANCSPYSPWNVAALGSSFRLEAAGQTLNTNLVPGATTLSLATGTGHTLFTTKAQYPADFPLDLNVGGWPIHVTDCTGASSPQTLTIDPAPNTSTIPAATPVTLWRPAALAL